MDEIKLPTYSEYVADLEDVFDKIQHEIAITGPRVDAKLLSNPNDDIYIIARDTLKRTLSNILVLRGIKISEHTCVAYRLILRATTADLIEAVYLLTLDNNERDEELKRRNVGALQTLNIFAKEKKSFYDSIDSNGDSGIDLSGIRKKYAEFINANTDDFITRKEAGSKIDTASMVKKLTSNGIWTNHYEQLYTNYRLLSLTEHYTPLFRKFSYNDEYDIIMYAQYVKWILIGTEILCKVIDEWLTTGKFERPKENGK
jgi:hypothetical protein